MGSAILKGYLKANPETGNEILAYNRNAAKTKALVEELGITECGSIREVAEQSDMVIIAVKPNTVSTVIEEMAPHLDLGRTLLVSVAAGVTISYLESLATTETLSCKVVRAMPNTPALVGLGMSALCRNKSVTDAEFDGVKGVFQAVGRVEEVPESLMDCVVGVSGSSPAYVYLFIEALADGAVAQGMSRDQAYTFAAQSVLGSAEMVLTTGIHPGALKDMVCSPGGTTIEAVQSLERNGFRHAVMEAVEAASLKSKAMKK